MVGPVVVRNEIKPRTIDATPERRMQFCHRGHGHARFFRRRTDHLVPQAIVAQVLHDEDELVQTDDVRVVDDRHPRRRLTGEVPIEEDLSPVVLEVDRRLPIRLVGSRQLYHHGLGPIPRQVLELDPHEPTQHTRPLPEGLHGQATDFNVLLACPKRSGDPTGRQILRSLRKWMQRMDALDRGQCGLRRCWTANRLGVGRQMVS